MADDVKARAVISVYAETAPAVKEIDKLTEAQKKMGDGFEKSGSSISDFIKTAADGFSQFNLAIGGVEKAFGFLKKGMDALKDVSAFNKLERSVPTETFKKLDEATGQLFTKTELLTFANRSLAGDLKLTEGQMADVLNASRALADKGIGEVQQNTEKLLKAVQKGGEGLDDFGLTIDKTNDKAKNAAATLEKLHGVAGDGKIDDETAALARMNRSLDDLSLGFKRVLAAATEAVEWLSRHGFSGADAASATGLSGKIALANKFAPPENTPLFSQDNLDYLGIGKVATFPGRRRPLGPGYSPMTEEDQRAYSQWLAAHPGGPYQLGGRAGYRDAGEHEVTPFWAVGQGDFGGSAWDSSAIDALESRQNTGQWWDRDRSAGGSYMGGVDRNRPTSPWDTFGKDTKKELGDAGFSALAGGINAAVQAAVDGSDAIGRSAAKASAAVLKSLAIEATGRAVFEGALALGSLAIQDYKGAALHGAAAAKFAIAAGLEGSLAAGLGAIAGGGGGGGGSGASAPAGGGFGSATGGTSGGGGTMNITINVGAGFAGDPKRLGEVVAREVRSAEMRGAARRNYVTEVSNG